METQQNVSDKTCVLKMAKIIIRANVYATFSKILIPSSHFDYCKCYNL